MKDTMFELPRHYLASSARGVTSDIPVWDGKRFDAYFKAHIFKKPAELKGCEHLSNLMKCESQAQEILVSHNPKKMRTQFIMYAPAVSADGAQLSVSEQAKIRNDARAAMEALARREMDRVQDPKKEVYIQALRVLNHTAHGDRPAFISITGEDDNPVIKMLLELHFA